MKSATQDFKKIKSVVYEYFNNSYGKQEIIIINLTEDNIEWSITPVGNTTYDTNRGTITLLGNTVATSKTVIVGNNKLWLYQ